MASGIKFDMTTFRAGLRAKLAVTKKTGAKVINQAAGSTLANAIRLTKKANAAEIRTSLQSNGTAFKLLQSPAMQSRLPRRFQGYTRGTHSRAEINDAATRFIRARAASRGNIAAGFFKALAVFRPGSARRVSDRGLAGKGRAKRATASRLVATFENFAAGADTVAAPALQQALDEEGVSMKTYGEARLAKAWK